jgi:hypothetical protein
LDREHGYQAAGSRLSTLSPSLIQDLMRFERGGQQSEVLDVVAACVRHQRALLIHLQCGERVVPLTLLPADRLAHCPMDMRQFFAMRLSELQVLQVEPAVLRAPGHEERNRVGEAPHYSPLSPLLWELAMRGAREELLPEIAGQAVYRMTSGFNLRELEITGAMASAVKRLKAQPCTLRDIANWPGFDRVRAARLLNALYLHAALMVSRTHPSANGQEGWAPWRRWLSA